MINGQPRAAEHDHHHHGFMSMKRISWTAVIVGALVGVGLSFLLNLFSVAIGLTGFTMTPDGAATLAVGGLIGVAIGVIVAMFVAGYVAGYLGRPYCGKHNLGVVYGFTAWCLALVISALVAGQLGKYVTDYSNFVSNPSVVATSSTQAPAVSASTSADGNTTQVAVNPNAFAMGAFVIFILFLLGALASSFGGHFGMAACCHDDDEPGHVHKECCK